MKGITRPEFSVLSGSSLIPDRNLIAPVPNQFTHELTRAQPFYFSGVQQGRPPDGELPAGTKVVLMIHDGGDSCRVVDGRGLYVETEFAGLRKL